MDSKYTELQKIYDKTRKDMFAIAVQQLMFEGFKTYNELTDEDINGFTSGTEMITDEFWRDINHLAKEIATACGDSPVCLIQFCMVTDIFDVRYFANKMPREELQVLAENAIKLWNDERGCFDAMTEDDCEELGVDPDDLRAMNFEVEEEDYEEVI